MHDNSVNISDRMKKYESIERKKLKAKAPIIIRINGRSFKTYTFSFNKPFDDNIIKAMKYTAVKLCEEIQNVKIAYSQSDEINLFLSDYDNNNTLKWFNGNIQKIVSLVASITTYHSNNYMNINYWNEYKRDIQPAIFDVRVFNLPQYEVINIFI